MEPEGTKLPAKRGFPRLLVPRSRETWGVCAGLPGRDLLVLVLLVSFLMLNATPTSSAADAEKRVIGAVEEVILVPWEMKVRARVDTGAVTSSLDAREIQVRGKGRSRSVHFVLMGESGRGIAVELPLAGQRLVINSDGVRERRPFARVEVCVAGLRVPLEVTLNDRSRMEYRMLLGRNLLEGRFIVDVERALTAPPACPAAP